MADMHILVGAQKSGTTSIYDILKNQPNVNLTLEKESKFFLRDDFFARGLPFYNNCFSKTPDAPRFEVDPDLLHFDFVPKRIYDTLGDDVKFMVLLRDPADRAWSAYMMERFRKREDLSWSDALIAEAERLKQGHTYERFGYQKRGFYYQQLQVFLNYYPIEKFRFFLFEDDFLKNRQQFFIDLADFLEVRFNQELNIDQKRNPTRRIRNKYIDAVLSKDNLARKMVRAVISEERATRWKARLYALNATQNVKERLSHTDHDRLIKDVFLDDIEQLEKLIGRSLASWKKPRSVIS